MVRGRQRGSEMTRGSKIGFGFHARENRDIRGGLGKGWGSFSRV